MQCVCKNEKKKGDMQKFGEELREKSTAARERRSFARGESQQSAAEKEAGFTLCCKHRAKCWPGLLDIISCEALLEFQMRMIKKLKIDILWEL